MKKHPKYSPHWDIDEKFEVCSATECTGLITVPPQDESELESYMQICNLAILEDGKK